MNMKAHAQIEAKDILSKSSSLSGYLKAREHENSESGQVPPIVHEVLRSPGRPLDAETRAYFEPRFAYDFSNIPVRSQSEAGEDRSGDATNRLCSLPTVSPRACPFGGACHTCPMRVQPKLKIGQPGDEYEQEADRVAEQVMQMREPQPEEETLVSATSDRGFIRRKCADCDDEDEMLQKKQPVGKSEAARENLSDIPKIIDRVLFSGGLPLDHATRTLMEPRFGHDFSQVRIHKNAQAGEFARAVNAQAFTVGPNIVLGEGYYSPETSTGKRLLAHELTHVLQQQSRPEPYIARRKKGTLPSVELTPEEEKRKRTSYDYGHIFNMMAGVLTKVTGKPYKAINAWSDFDFYLKATREIGDLSPGIGRYLLAKEPEKSSLLVYVRIR